jgi:hypothetical protein
MSENIVCENSWNDETLARPPLNGLDLCDHCHVTQALVRVAREGLLTLDFCGHDYMENFKALQDDGWTVVEDGRFKPKVH